MQSIREDILKHINSEKKIDILLKSMDGLKNNKKDIDDSVLKNYLKYAIRNLMYFKNINFFKEKNKEEQSPTILPKIEPQINKQHTIDSKSKEKLKEIIKVKVNLMLDVKIDNINETNNKNETITPFKIEGVVVKDLINKKIVKNLEKTTQLLENFNNNSFNKGNNVKLSNQLQIRCDFGVTNEDKTILFDAKNYSKIQPYFKFPKYKKLKSENFTKTFDSNLKRELSFFNFKKTNLTDKTNLDIESFFENIIKNKDIKNKEILIPTQIFKNIFLFGEFGFYGLTDTDLKKCLIVKEDNENILIKQITVLEFLKNKENIQVEYFIDKMTNYKYVLFKYNNKVFYILSSRTNSKTNCSFISNEFLKTIQREKIDNKFFLYNTSGKEFEKYVWKKIDFKKVFMNF